MSAEDVAYDGVISLSGEVLGGDELAGDVVVLGSLQDVGLAVIAEDESDLTIDLVLVDSVDDGLSIEWRRVRHTCMSVPLVEPRTPMRTLRARAR